MNEPQCLEEPSALNMFQCLTKAEQIEVVANLEKQFLNKSQKTSDDQLRELVADDTVSAPCGFASLALG